MKQLRLTAILAASLSPIAVMAQDMPGEGVTVRPILQPVLEEVFQHRVLLQALEDPCYTVEESEEVMA